jgi:hypothetical protein
MPDLLHEYWENEDSGEFGRVGEHNDRLRSTITPNARRVFSLRASSWHQAMRLYNARLGYGEYRTEGLPDIFYTDEEGIEQAAYLLVREVS